MLMRGKPGENIHRRKNFDGRSPEAVHRETAWPLGVRCGLCGSQKVAIRFRSLMLAKDLVEYHPELAMRLNAQSLGQGVLCVETKMGRMAVIGEQYACDYCRAQAERVAAKAPSNVLMEIEVGPGDHNPIVAVPR